MEFISLPKGRKKTNTNTKVRIKPRSFFFWGGGTETCLCTASSVLRTSTEGKEQSANKGAGPNIASATGKCSMKCFDFQSLEWVWGAFGTNPPNLGILFSSSLGQWSPCMSVSTLEEEIVPDIAASGNIIGKLLIGCLPENGKSTSQCYCRVGGEDTASSIGMFGHLLVAHATGKSFLKPCAMIVRGARIQRSSAESLHAFAQTLPPTGSRCHVIFRAQWRLAQ